jgi:hypothetical protein
VSYQGGINLSSTNFFPDYISSPGKRFTHLRKKFIFLKRGIGRLRQENHEFQASLKNSMTRSCLKKNLKWGVKRIRGPKGGLIGTGKDWRQ